jgi:cytochrome c oxidase subunit 2
MRPARAAIAGALLAGARAAHAAVPAMHDVQAPAGPQAEALFEIWLLMLALCTLVFVAVMVALAIALWRAPRADAATLPDVSSLSKSEPRLARPVGAAVALSLVLLLGLLGASVFADRALARLPLANALHVELTAHQWWWEARYDDADPSKVFTTANELHVPVGRPVVLTLKADDVIHSFWVPNLHGKKDLIPGRESTFSFRADRAGVYRGQCAEYCGYQHANMALFVVADAPADYERWALQQLAPARDPTTEEQKQGMALFVGTTCAMCHAIQGTSAQGRRAPDLTHVASRMTLAAGTILNNAGTRAAWIANPQGIKPGVNMPAHALAPPDLAAINAYLGSLQ